METGELALLGIIELAEAKRLRSLLEMKGILLKLVNNPETCSTGNCSKGVEVYVSQEQVEAVLNHIKSEKLRLLEGLDVDHARHDEVFDDEKETAICPACGTQFATTLTECPDCGLGFSAGP